MKNRAFDHRHYSDWRKPEDLVPYGLNAKIHDDRQIKNLVTSLKRFGWQQDCVITSDNVLVIGHGRRMAAMRIGCEIPVHVIDKKAEDLTDEDIRELRIADNQTNAETGFDFDLLQEDLEGLDFDGFDFDFGLPDEEFQGDLENHQGNLISDFLQPPFSVLRGNSGEWGERKRAWIAKGIKSELGRG